MDRYVEEVQSVVACKEQCTSEPSVWATKTDADASQIKSAIVP